MRICLVSTTYPPRTGGLETHIATLSRTLAEHGNAVTVLTNRDSADQPERSDDHGVRVLRTGALLHPVTGDDQLVPWETALFGLLGDVELLLRGEEFDVIHTHTQAALLLAALAGLPHRAPLVASFHETDPQLDPCGTERSRFILRQAGAELLLTGSHAFATQAADPRSIRTVHHGLPDPGAPEPDRHLARARLRDLAGIPTDGTLITLVGRFKPRKGQHRLLDAYLRMRQRDRTRLLLLGSCNSGDTQYLVRLHAYLNDHGLGERVTILRDVPPEARDLAWAATDIATQPSTREGLGLAAVEAMLAATPVVATDTDGLREVVTPDTGLLIDTHDPVAYATALDTLVADPSRRTLLGSAGRARALDRFSLDRAVRQTLGVYREARHLHPATRTGRALV